MKIFNNIIVNRSRNLPVRSAFSQPLRHRVPQKEKKIPAPKG
jgi:hypothetical protein